MRPIRTLIVGIIFVAGVLVGPAFAHTTERAFVLVLPTELYLTGGTLAVALSFVLMVLMPVADPRALEAMTWRVGRLPAGLGNALALLFGPAVWLRFGEAFSVLFRFLSWLSPFGGRPAQEGGIFATLPGFGLLRAPVLPPSGVAFVLLALASARFP